MRLLLAALLALPPALSPFSGLLHAQVTKEPETFDVVSIRENRDGSIAYIQAQPSGLVATNSTALDLVRWQFNVVARDVVGELPGWATTTKFDVIARTEGGPLTSSRLRTMTRALLEDRFRLDASLERAEGPVYALVTERSGLRPLAGGKGSRPSESTCAVDPPLKVLEPVRVLDGTANCGVKFFLGGGALTGVHGVRATMQQLAKSLSRTGGFDRPIVDRTGVDGEFDFAAITAADMVAPTGQARFLIALREQLGLTLRAEQGTYDVLRVRRIERPSPN